MRKLTFIQWQVVFTPLSLYFFQCLHAPFHTSCDSFYGQFLLCKCMQSLYFGVTQQPKTKPLVTPQLLSDGGIRSGVIGTKYEHNLLIIIRLQYHLGKYNSRLLQFHLQLSLVVFYRILYFLLILSVAVFTTSWLLARVFMR